jgi:hypothetical protein
MTLNSPVDCPSFAVVAVRVFGAKRLGLDSIYVLLQNLLCTELMSVHVLVSRSKVSMSLELENA